MGSWDSRASAAGAPAGERFRLGGSARTQRWAPFALAVVGLATLVASAVAGDAQTAGIALVITVLLGTTSVRYLQMPHQIVLDHEGLQFVAHSGTTAVPWRKLRAVEVVQGGVYPDSLRWRWIGGSVHTLAPWERQDVLLSTAMERAPGVHLRGF